MALHNYKESEEMYLKTISKLSKELPKVRAVDVGEELGYAKSSVSRAVAILEKDNYITRDTENHIYLTEKGKEQADYLNDRYDVIKAIFDHFEVPTDLASKTACDIEHLIPKEVYIYLKAHLSNRKA